jgi:hypothetical protein
MCYYIFIKAECANTRLYNWLGWRLSLQVVKEIKPTFGADEPWGGFLLSLVGNFDVC